jgi:hypothetical protein
MTGCKSAKEEERDQVKWKGFDWKITSLPVK